MAKDVFHQQVKKALIKDGWIITHDPYYNSY
ncbi:element excision factor XisH family protein [Nostoc sp. UIC 10630]